MVECSLLWAHFSKSVGPAEAEGSYPPEEKTLDCLRQCLKDTVSSYKTAGEKKENPFKHF